jgi:anaerobic magnesium-protoporphyrin IX monomethyl ester cyclase
MTVLFVMPPGGVTPEFSEHLGTAFLRTMLARAGVQSEQYLPGRNVSLREFAGFLAVSRPAVVGFTMYETNLRVCRAMVGAVRACLPEAVIMVGGPNATFSPEDTLRLIPADVCFRGAGEGVIVGILQALLGADRPRRDLPGLLGAFPNLAIATPDGTRWTRPADLSSFPRGYFERLDDLPSPYRAGQIASADVGLLTSRGCNQHCTYCSFATISGRKVHFHGVERVLDDLAALKAIADRGGLRRSSISILDDAFTLSPQRARAICEGVLERGLQVPLDCQTRVDHVDRDLLHLMRRAGFVGISFGLESAVPRILRAIGKVQDPACRGDDGFEAEREYLERAREAVADAKAAGLSPSVSVIGGLPGETADDFRATLDFVGSLDVPSYAHNVLALLPGTPLHAVGGAYGIGAGRDPVSGSWRTRHAYDVHSVPPLRNSMDRAELWNEANEICDALCGRPRPSAASDGAAWAVILHQGVDPDVANWLPGVLAVNGAVVVLSSTSDCPPAERARWFEALDEARVPWGRIAFLVPERQAGDAIVLRSHGTIGEHRFAIHSRWPGDSLAVKVDARGNCQVPIWRAPDGSSAGPEAPHGGAFGSSAQIADACRWWSGWRRCRTPRVLHVFPGGAVRPCWHGPIIGGVGAEYGALASACQGLRPADQGPARRGDRCPVPEATGENGSDEAAEEHEIAAQLSWLVGGRGEKHMQ